MSELPDNVDLQWVGKTLLAMRDELSAIRDEVLVLGARQTRVEAGVTLVLAELQALRNQLTRMNSRIETLEVAHANP